MKEAYLYEKLDNNLVKCQLCNQGCVIKPEGRGLCGVRENNEGTLFTRTYGKIIALAIDPIEKKPLFHFLPGSNTLSLALAGCNFKCSFCQNSDISQLTKSDENELGGPASPTSLGVQDLSPEAIVQMAIENNCPSISYTYTEPTVFFEFAYDTAKIAHERGLKNIFVTNGYMTEKALRMIRPYLDAMNIDLKSSSNEYYRKHCGARIEPVKNNIKLARKMGIWVEVTTLVVPKENDTLSEFKSIAKFISDLGQDIPWHISRFYPAYQMKDHEITPEETLRKAYEIGKKSGLNYVYIGNINDEKTQTTYCPKCGENLIRRVNYQIFINLKKGEKCPKCGKKLRILTK